ncbi:MAG: hypothetical protein WEB60_12560 [Terrimicrobiaceae bacterium]
MMEEIRENEDVRVGYLLSWVLTGTEEGAGKSVCEAIQEVASHPAASDHHKRYQLFLSVVRRRSLKFPARDELPEALRELHKSPEPGRSVLALQELLQGKEQSGAAALVGLDPRSATEAAQKLKETLAEPSHLAKELASMEPSPGTECLAAIKTYLHGPEHSAVKNPATIAVGAAFLILIAVVVWQMTGKVGVFPEEAIKIATEARRAAQENFAPMDAGLDTLPDWFAMQGFEGFQIPPGLENLNAVGVRTFSHDGASLAQVAVLHEEKNLYLVSFPAAAFEIRNLPSQTWQVASSGRYAFAIREENGMCILITFAGSEEDMKSFLASLAGP